MKSFIDQHTPGQICCKQDANWMQIIDKLDADHIQLRSTE